MAFTRAEVDLIKKFIKHSDFVQHRMDKKSLKLLERLLSNLVEELHQNGDNDFKILATPENLKLVKTVFKKRYPKDDPGEHFVIRGKKILTADVYLVAFLIDRCTEQIR